MAAYEGTDALLLGRRTYDIFAAYWPHQEGGEDNEIATLFNSVPKYVASAAGPTSRGPGPRSSADLAGAVREIGTGEHVKVVGSLNLVQTLLREKLFDRLDLWVHPVVLGVGKKVFDGGAVPTNVTLLGARNRSGHRVPAHGLASSARDGGHERTRSRCPARRLRPPAPGGSVSSAVNPPGRHFVAASAVRGADAGIVPRQRVAATQWSGRQWPGRPVALASCRA